MSVSVLIDNLTCAGYVILPETSSIYLTTALIIIRGRVFANGAMGRRIDPSWGGPTELFLVPASAPQLE